MARLCSLLILIYLHDTAGLPRLATGHTDPDERDRNLKQCDNSARRGGEVNQSVEEPAEDFLPDGDILHADVRWDPAL